MASEQRRLYRFGQSSDGFAMSLQFWLFGFQRGATCVKPRNLDGGDERTRTADFYDANVWLSVS